MDYSQLKDFQINAAIGNSQGLDVPFGKAVRGSHSNSAAYSRCGKTLDYCNNPSDIMPLMVEHKIGLQFDELFGLNGTWIASKAVVDDCCAIVGAFQSEHENPYRAIAICFLKMQEAEA